MQISQPILTPSSDVSHGGPCISRLTKRDTLVDDPIYLDFAALGA
jgi:hypothetical protein